MKVSFEVFLKKGGRKQLEAEGSTYADCLAQIKKTPGFVRVGISRVVSGAVAKTEAPA